MGGNGVLETVMVAAGSGKMEPLFRAMQLESHAARQAAIIDALPRDVALQAITELHQVGAKYELRVPWRSELLETIGEGERDWAIARANDYVDGPPDQIPYLKMYIFRALVRSKAGIEQRWEHLYPNVLGASYELLLECARGLPEDRRAAVLAPHFPTMGSSINIVMTIPSPELVLAFLKSTEVGTPAFATNLHYMKQVAEKNKAVRVVVDAFVAAMPAPPKLFVTSITKPKSVTELSPIAREQLRIAGKGYDEQDLEAEARLADNGEETSFHGFFELREIADAEGIPAYDMLVYAVDSGSIFEAGTLKEIGGLSQGGVDLKERNEPLRSALQTASQVKKVQAPKAAKSASPAKKSPAKPAKKSPAKPAKK